MKKINQFLKTIMLVIPMIIVLSLGNISFGAKMTPGKYFKLYNGNARPTGSYTQSATDGDIPVIKIREVNSSGQPGGSYDNTIAYCLRNGIGFGSHVSDNTVINYTQQFDLSSPSAIPSPYREVLPTDMSNYNKMMWVLNNICDPADESSKERLMSEISYPEDAFKSYVLPGQNTTDSEKDIIEVVQQSAIWYFANTNSDAVSKRPSRNAAFQWNGSGLANYNEEGGFVAGDDPASDLYTYLIETATIAVNNGYTYETNNPSINFNKTNATVTASDSTGAGYYLVGPYKLEVNNITTLNNIGGYTLSAEIKGNGTSLTNVTLVDSDGVELLGQSGTPTASIADKIHNNANKDFYIKVPDTTSATNISISVSGSYNKTSLEYWSVDKDDARYEFAKNQPVVVIKKENKPFTGSDTKNITKPEFDLALRKFITEIRSNGVTTNYNSTREPKFTQEDLRLLATGGAQLDGGTTLTKRHSKDPISVKTGDTVVYTIRVYNEGQVDGKATEITDFLPEGLELKTASAINTTYGWTPSSTDSKKITSNYLQNATISAFNLTPTSGTYAISYVDLQVECTVVATTSATDTHLKNIAAITACTDAAGNAVTDRDSQPETVNGNPSTYNPEAPTAGKGEQDDDDYEDLVLPGKYFDLALRKFIVGVNDKLFRHQDTSGNNVWDREPIVDTSVYGTTRNGKEVTTFDYKHRKDAISVSAGDIVTYAIRVYNENQVAGYVNEIVDHLPEELEFIADTTSTDERIRQAAEYNANNGWTLDPSDTTLRTVRTNKLSKAIDTDNIIPAFDSATMQNNPAYKEVYIQCKVKSTAPALKEITNIAEITQYENTDGLADRDNVANVTLPSDNDLPNYRGNSENAGLEPADMNNYFKGQEDDDDFEKVILQRFDLALRKFITGVNDEVVTNREPQVDTTKYGTIGEDGKEITTFTYTHTKEPIKVCQNDIVTYTIRVYNEGNQSGYASGIKDDIPEGLEFLPDHEINNASGYNWKMLDKDGNVTTDVSKAVAIETDYLSFENTEISSEGVSKNLLKAFDATTMQNNPAYLDVKVAFKVIEPNTSDRIIINKAQISKDQNENGEDVNDIDSTPDKWIEGEDDQDIEKLYVKYFDLALRKWVTQAIVIEDGVQKVMETDHYAEQEPEPVVKVEVNKKRMNDTVIKFKYNIRVVNEGEIEGYATELSDYIPNGLKFNQADNPKWKEANGKITTDQLKDTLLKPGEQAIVDLILTWVNDENNMGVMTNWAEISKDKNDSNTHDIDSTPNNKVEGEDDFDYAPVALTVVAGSAPTYIVLAGGILVILAAGVFLIKKFVI